MKKTTTIISILIGIIALLCAVIVVEKNRIPSDYVTEETLAQDDGESFLLPNQDDELGENEEVIKRELSALKVVGCDLCDADGNKIQLRGMSSHGLLWYPEYINAAAMESLKAHGSNAFRVAMYANDGNGGYVQQTEMSTKLMLQAIETVIAEEMYVIVDFHVLNECNPLNDLEAAKIFFTDIASRYADNPAVIYEICNEPNGETSWEDIKSYANEIIPIIRNYSPNALILVGTPNYSYSITQITNDLLPYENIMYSYHFYAGQFGNEYTNMIQDCQKIGMPIFVSEWGVNLDQNAEALQQAEEFINYVNEQGLSWMAWSLSNKAECFSVIQSDCKKLSDWEDNDLTDVGKLVFSSFGGDS